MLTYSFKSIQCTFSVKLIILSILGFTHSGIVGSTSKATHLGWLLGVGNVTAGFATCNTQVATTLSWYSEPLAMVASWTEHSLIRGMLLDQRCCWFIYLILKMCIFIIHSIIIYQHWGWIYRLKVTSWVTKWGFQIAKNRLGILRMLWHSKMPFTM